jgi:proline racemase
MRLNQVLHLVTAHTEGVVCDVLVGGLPRIPGRTMLEKKAYFESNLDHIRTLLVLEPRGARTQSVNVIVPATDDRAEFGFLTLETDEIVDMSGGNIIATATVLLETGMIPTTEPVTVFALESPAGLIEVSARMEGGKALDVTFTNQPAFLVASDKEIDVAEVGRLRVDVGWGGMFYVMVEASDVGLTLEPASHLEVVRIGEAIKAAARQQIGAVHPENPALGRPEVGGIQATLFADTLWETDDGALRSRNAVVVSPGYIDRCPCGTGTSARLALMKQRGQIDVGRSFIHESIIGTTFSSEIVDTTDVAGIPAVLTRIAGSAYLTGTRTVGVDPADPFPSGFSMETLAAGTVDVRHTLSRRAH